MARMRPCTALQALTNCSDLRTLRLAKLPINAQPSCVGGPPDLPQLPGLKFAKDGRVKGGRLAQLSKICQRLRVQWITGEVVRRP